MSIPVVTSSKELAELPREVAKALYNDVPYKRFENNKDTEPGGWYPDDRTVSILTSYIGPEVVLGSFVVVEYSNLNGRIQAHGTRDVKTLIRECQITGDYVFMGPICLIGETLKNTGPASYQAAQTSQIDLLRAELTAPSAARQTPWL